MTDTRFPWLTEPPDLRPLTDVMDPPEISADGRCSDCFSTGVRFIQRDGRTVPAPCLCPAAAGLRYAGCDHP